MRESGKFSAAQMKLAELAMKMQEWADWQTVSIGWMAVYDKELRTNGGNEEAAIARADEVVLETQPTMDETELAPIFRAGKGHLPKVLTRYGAPLNVVWNQLSYGIPNAIRNRNFRYVIGIYTSFALANTLVALMRGKLRDEDDDDETQVRKWIYYLALSPITESVPLVSDLASWAVERLQTREKLPRFQKKLYPLAEQAGNAIIEAVEAAQMDGGTLKQKKEREEKFKKAAWDGLMTVMYGVGLPANQVNKFKTALEEESFWPVLGFRRKGKKK
jgi:hypothetical protein